MGMDTLDMYSAIYVVRHIAKELNSLITRSEDAEDAPSHDLQVY